MNSQTIPAGAMPVVAGAMPAQSYLSGPVFAAYRLPFAGAAGARDVGVCFEGDEGGGANPPAGGPPPNPPAGGPPPPPPPPATGDPDGLGDAGKKALEAERAGRAEEKRLRLVAEGELGVLKTAGATDSEKAIAAARKEGSDEVIGRVHAQARRTAVRGALTIAGVPASLVADLARAEEFAGLKVNDDDEVDVKELEAAVAKHKARVPDAYKVAGAGGAPSAHTDGGVKPGDGKPLDLAGSVAEHYRTKSS